MRNKFKDLSPELMENHYSNFLLNSWSYSKVSAFARNPAAFEMNYLYGVYGKSSASSMAGKAYHFALDYFFSQKKKGVDIDLVELEQTAFKYLDEQPANFWKLQKTTPTIEEAFAKANESVVKLLKSFVGEIGTYMDDIAEILEVEVYCDEWIVVNGVEIPLPCHAKIDLVVKTKSGAIAVVDHKSKDKFSEPEEMALDIGSQAITYVKVYEEKSGIHVDEIWFIENKIPTNKNGSPQLSPLKLKIDDNTRMLYELILYSPLKAMIHAINDVDYDFLINPNDNFVNKAELWDHWCRTRIAEVGVDDFNIEEAKKELIGKRLRKIKDTSIQMVPPQVIKTFRENASKFIQYDLSNKDMSQSQKIEHVLRSFSTPVEVAHTFEGYSSDTYLLKIQAGVKVASIHNKRLDLANALDVENVRISKDLVVHESKSYLAIEVKKRREKDLSFDINELHQFKIPIGKDNFGNTIVWDLRNQSTPHALVCGQTGSGKSVCLESAIEYGKEAGVEEIYVFCRKKDFNHLHDHNQVFVYNSIEDIEEQAANLVQEMNQLIESGREKLIMVIFDEYADAILSARSGKELEKRENVHVGYYANGNPKFQVQKTGEIKSLGDNLQALLQTGRSSGFRVLAATQRASVDVIKGDAKVNFPVRICFKVQSKVDSKVVLDEEGAESLAGKGDGLIKSPEYNDTVRFQAFYKPAAVMA